MADIVNHGTVWRLTLTSADTYDWARRPGMSWPCSTLSGQAFTADFDAKNGDLVDCSGSSEDWDGSEFTAITDDFLRELLPEGHGARIGADFRHARDRYIYRRGE